MNGKVLLCLLLATIIPIDAFSADPVKTGTVTLKNAELSFNNGYAFIDFNGSGSVTLSDYVGYKIKICSAADPTQCAQGYIKDAGTVRTYGSEEVVGGDFGTNLCGTTWTCASGYSMSGGKLNLSSVASYATALHSSPPVLHARYKMSFDLDSVTAGYVKSIKGSDAMEVHNTTGTKEYSFTAGTALGNNVIQTYTITTAVIDNFSVKKVISPSSTGVTLVSTPAGTTQSVLSDTFSTKIMDASGYNYEIYPSAAQIISGNNNTLSYGLIDCEDLSGMTGMLVTGTGNTIENYTVVRCPGGAFQFDESATLKNTIGISSGPDITIATGKTVMGKNNLFGDAAKTGEGTYTDVGGQTQWSTDPVFVDPDNGNFRLQSTSPAINAGTRD